MEISVEHHDSVGEYMYCISVSKLPTQVTVSIRVLGVSVCVCVCVCVCAHVSKVILLKQSILRYLVPRVH